MSIDLSQYYNKLKSKIGGSISGFTSIETLDGPIEETGTSLDAIRRKLKVQEDATAPERLRAIIKMILSHIQDHDNPHKDTLDMLTADFAGDVLGAFIPGTIPTTYPVCGYVPFVDIDPDLDIIQTTRSTALTVLDKQGYYKTGDVNTPVIDWSRGVAELVCWPDTVSVLTTGDTTAAGSVGSTGLTQSSVTPTIKSPSGLTTDYVTFSEMGGTTYHEAAIDLPITAKGETWVGSVVIYPYLPSGTLYVCLRSNRLNYVAIDLATRTVTTSNDTVVTHVRILPNGWIRVGYEFTAADVDPSAHVVDGVFSRTETMLIGISPVGSSVASSYLGIDGRRMFSLHYKQLTQGSGLCPAIIPDGATVGGSSHQIVSNNTLPSVRGMLVLDYIVDQVTDTTPIPLLDTRTGITLELTGGTVTAEVNYPSNAVSSTNTVSTDVVNTSAISWDTNKTCFKTSGNIPKKTITSINSSLEQIQSVSIDSFRGGICRYELYGVSDDALTLEFLVGEK